LKYFISNEYFSWSILNTPQKLQLLDLSSYLISYLELIANSDDDKSDNKYIVFPVPAKDFISVKSDETLGQAVTGSSTWLGMRYLQVL